MNKHGSGDRRRTNIGHCAGWSRRPLEETDADAKEIIFLRTLFADVEIERMKRDGKRPVVAQRLRDRNAEVALKVIKDFQDANVKTETKDEIIARQAAEIASLQAQLKALLK